MTLSPTPSSPLTPKIVWAEILKHLAQTMPASTFSTWVKPLSLTHIETVAADRAILTFTAVSPYVAQQAEMRCYAQIKQAADLATRKLCDLVFTLQDQNLPSHNFTNEADLVGNNDSNRDHNQRDKTSNLSGVGSGNGRNSSGIGGGNSNRNEDNNGRGDRKNRTNYMQAVAEAGLSSTNHSVESTHSAQTTQPSFTTAPSTAAATATPTIAATLRSNSPLSSLHHPPITPINYPVNTPPTLFSPQQISMPVVDRYKLAAQKAHLREDFTFDTFAVSGSNEMAYAAAQAVAKSPGSVYNPLFLWGGVGVGKTHLMQSIGNVMLRANPDTPLLYTMGEEFLNEIIGAIRTKRTLDFKEKFRQLKVLLIDDIQFIAGKDTAQEEFFHTFNAITRAGGQIIMTSDRPPHEIHPLEDRLRSRFEGGLTIDIQQPTFELRTAILLIKAQKIGLELPMELAQMAAAEVESTRKLEGVIFKLHSAHRFQRRVLDEQLVREVLGGESKPVISKKKLKPSAILRAVTSHFHVSANTLRSGSRKKEYVTARHIAMFLMKSELNMPYAEIGATFGGRDHTSVMHAVQKIEQCLSDSAPPSQDVSAIRVSLSSL